QAFDDAAKLLDGKAEASLEARFLEARGDLHLMRDQRDEARAAYQSALTKLDDMIKAEGEAASLAQQGYRNVIEIKLDAVGGKQ
ncbi:tetratricopeptide repeat protein, partial [Acinetobacter baumannii]